MPLVNGSRLGPYTILTLLGSGGMGEVYKARDTRLERTVAIKILSDEFATNPVRRERFEREARAAAALSHPHICALHDIGETSATESAGAKGTSIRFLVMECLEGQTLADRLVRGPLPPADVLRYASELADALDHAHRRGLIHRDVKPGNVMLTRDGAKLLDFGLSKAQPPTVPALSTVSPAGAPVTAEGELLGTFPYMAPEQLQGREADARTDVFALGAVIYEMATGRRAFEGTTSATVIGAILHTDPPPVSTLQPLAPRALDRIVARCLAKNPDDRWQSARDLTLELRWITGHDARVEDHAVRSSRAGVMLAGALGVIAVAASVLAVWYLRRPALSEAPPVRLAFSPPDGLTLADVGVGGSVTLSPDGQRLAFVAAGSDSGQGLWVRSLDSATAQLLAGTDGAAFPFWSPDSRFIGFFAQGKLKKVRVSGGPPQIVCDAVRPTGGTWNGDGMILFSSGAGHQLVRVSAGGGATTLLPPDPTNEERHRPYFLPNGRQFTYYGRPQKWGIYAASLDSPTVSHFLREGVGAAYANGHLLVLLGATRGSDTGTLWAQRFDADRLELSGEAVALAEQVAYRSGGASSAFAVSENGRLVYGIGKSPAARLTWFDRKGKPLGNVGGSFEYTRPSLSPDDRTIAVQRVDPETQQDDIWLIDASRGTALRFTSYPNLDVEPVWSPDGTQIVFASPRNTPPNLYRKALTTGSEQLLVKSDRNNQPSDWSPDGRFIVYESLDPKTQWDVWLLPVSRAEVDQKPVPFLRTEFNEFLGRLSPDGRWLAYVSDESGKDEVYVTTFPASGPKWLVSARGGTAPRWRGDGTELFYLSADGALMVVSLKLGSKFAAGAPVVLFKPRISLGAGYYFRDDDRYTVARDGQRFLIETVEDDAGPSPPTIVLNWPAALGRR